MDNFTNSCEVVTTRVRTDLGTDTEPLGLSINCGPNRAPICTVDRCRSSGEMVDNHWRWFAPNHTHYAIPGGVVFHLRLRWASQWTVIG